MTWLNQFEDRANLNGSNGVNNEDIKQMAIWSGFDEERAKFDIRLAYLYRFARSSLEHEEHMIEIGSKTTAFAASHGSKEST